MRNIAGFRRSGRWARKIATFAVVFGAVVAFLGLVLLGALRLPPVRTFAVAQVNKALEGVFVGKLRIEQVARIGPIGAGGVNATVFDANGRAVLIVRGASARLAVVPLLWAVLVHPHGPLTIDIGPVTVDHVEAHLIDAGHGLPTLGAAFYPPHPNVGMNHSEIPTIHIRPIEINHVWVHGRFGSAPAIDADIGHAVAKLELDAARLRLQIDRADVHARGLPYAADPAGETGGVMDLPIAAKSTVGNGKEGGLGASGPVVHAWYNGDLTGSRIAARFDWTDEKISASLDAPRIEPVSVMRVAPGAHLMHSLMLHATAEGALSDIHFEARASVVDESTGAPVSSPAAVVVAGHAAIDEYAAIDAEIRAEDVDLAALLADAPESRLGGRAHVYVTRTRQGAITGHYDGSSSPGLIAGTQLPAIDLEGDLRQDPARALTTKGQARILEPGAHTTVDYSVTLSSKRSESVVSIDSSTEVADPKRLRTFADGLLARGSVEVSARYWPDDGHWTAQTHAWLHEVRQAQVGVGEIDVRAQAAGGQHEPSGVIHVLARDITAAGRNFRRLDLDSDGTLARAQISANLERDDAQRFELTTELSLRPTLRVQHTHLELPSSKGAITISLDDLRSSGGATRIDGLRIEGAGTAVASLTFGRELEQLDLSTNSFDWARLARLLGVPLPVRAGRATLVARYASQGPESGGFVRGRVDQVQIGPVQDASADVNLMLARQQIDGTLTAQLAPGSDVRISVQALPLNKVDRPDLALDSRDFSLSVRAAIDLANIGPWIRALDVPLDHASGSIWLDLTARGPSDGREYPELLAHLETRSLELAGRRDEYASIQDAAVARRAQPWSLQGVDGKLDLTITGDRPRAAASARLFDKRGTLVELQASADLPASAERTLRLSTSEALRMPLAATLHMPPRQFRQLPPMVRDQSLRGIASLDVALQGTLENPTLVVDGTIERMSTLTERIAGKETLKLDMSVHAEGSRREGSVRAEARVHSRRVGNLEANWKGDIVSLSSTSLDAPSPLQGDLVARFDRLPLDALPSFRIRQLSGELTGNVTLRDWGRNATLVALLDTEQLELGQVVVERAKVSLNGADGQLVANVRLSGKNSGTLEADAATQMSWGDRLVPSVDPGIHGGLRAKGFQLGVLSPFLSGSVNELEGSIDATLDATLDNGVPRIKGQATLSQGIIQVPSIGQRFDSIGAHVTIHDGDLRVDNLQARGLTGRATGSARLRLEGLSPTSGEAHVAIQRGEPIPITIEGQAVGDAWGRVDVTLNRSAETKSTKIRVDLPELHLDLPDVDPTSLQDLDLAENVRIGAHRSDGRFVSLPVQPIANEAQGGGEALVVAVHLGNAVWIQKGPGIKVQLGGDLLARIADETTLEGRLELKGGKLDVSGKTFEIESGVVTFDGGDPGNPSIIATARWDSPDDYRVYAEYAGTVKDGKLKLRSDPPLSADKVVSLLLFGTPDGAFGANGQQGKGGDSTGSAIGVAGDPAVQGLNRAISGVTKLDVSARLDTSTGTARPELDVQLSPRVTARMTRAIGEPAAGQIPDRTFLTLELRLRRAWALSAVVGDHGASGLDLVWRRRY